ncbi:MAG: oxaloacetate decarboxylase subunit alpha [Defluviitaleaceae bacterium]|nr:oxaloacetate decarboxylase subunit alpha [Defluviitaleaceae bacterium]
MDTTLRDGQQCLIATRMKTEEMVPILDTMDKAGFSSVEVWGGATFDAAMRFLKEDPWERLRIFRKHFKNTKLQMLFRGQNMLGYKGYHDESVERFVELAIKNGIDIIRIFDALNDTRNLASSVAATKKYGGHAQLAICYTTSEIHTIEYFVDLAKTLADMGADSIAIKDMAGLLVPSVAYDLVKSIKAVTSLPLDIHTHCTSGMADMVYLKAVEAGVDTLDTASSPFALGTSQPATEVMNEAIKGLGYSTDLDSNALLKMASYFRPLRDSAIDSGLLSPKVLSVDLEALIYQVPGGMLSNLISQLKTQKAEDKYDEVLREVPRVRADLGYPPLVTPSSQIVGTQAVMNVLTGERYKVVPNETKDIVRGMYGKTPAPISDEVRKKIIGDEQPISVAPAALLKPALADAEASIKHYITQPEDVLSYVMFPQVAEDFFKFRQAQQTGIDPNMADRANNVYPV